MTDHKATSEQWAQLEAWMEIESEYSACVLELRARVEALEAASRARLIEIIRLTNAVADQVPDRTKFFTDTMADEDDAKPTPNDRQIRSSLVKRVALAISGIEYGLERDEEAVNWASEARAAIREVAAWMTSNPHIYFPPALVFAIEQEVDQ
jgi:hypothetical protein